MAILMMRRLSGSEQASLALCLLCLYRQQGFQGLDDGARILGKRTLAANGIVDVEARREQGLGRWAYSRKIMHQEQKMAPRHHE